MNKALSVKKRPRFPLSTICACTILVTSITTPALAVTFSEALVELPYTLTQEVIAADILTSPGKELVTFSIDEHNNQWLIIYQLETKTNQYLVAQKTIVPSAFYQFDIGEIQAGGLQKLYFLSSKGLSVYQDNQFKMIATTPSLYLPEEADFLSRGHFLEDLNGDTYDDVVIADFTMMHIYSGQKQGGFTHQTLPIKPIVRSVRDGATYRQSKLYYGDVTFDGKADILLVGDGEMSIYPQGEHSDFKSEVIKIAINENISGSDWWSQRNKSGERVDQSNLAYRKLEALRDVNADGITDMVVRYTKTSGVFDRVNDYEIYLGQKISENQEGESSDKGRLHFAQQASSVIQAEGTLTGIEFIDINNDDKEEVLLAGFDIGLSQVIAALVTGAIDQDVYVFTMDEQDKFPTKPVIKAQVELTFSLTSGQSGSPVVKLADVNGDGYKDLVLSDDDDELEIYLGQENGSQAFTFEKQGVSYNIELPNNGQKIKAEDLNADGKDDLLLRYARSDGNKMEKTFKVLFAK